MIPRSWMTSLPDGQTIAYEASIPVGGIAMGGEWGLGASLALESVSPRFRGFISGLLQEGYAAGALLASLVYRFVYPDYGWRPLFLIGGLPALLAIFIRMKVKESPAWHEHKTDWAGYGRALTANWRRFAFLVLMMTMMSMMHLVGLAHRQQNRNYFAVLRHE